MRKITIHQYYAGDFKEIIQKENFHVDQLWSIRPFNNYPKQLTGGKTSDFELFMQFMESYSNNPHATPLMICFAKSEKNNPNNMLHTTRKYIKVEFNLQPNEYFEEPVYC